MLGAVGKSGCSTGSTASKDVGPGIDHVFACAEGGHSQVQVLENVGLHVESLEGVEDSHDDSPEVSDTGGEDASTSEDCLEQIGSLVGSVGSI